MKIIRDTREQAPFTFAGYDCEVQAVTLTRAANPERGNQQVTFRRLRGTAQCRQMQKRKGAGAKYGTHARKAALGLARGVFAKSWG